MAKKKGLITNAEVAESRERAIELANKAREKIINFIPHRIDRLTVIYVRADRDTDEQVERFVRRLEKDRMKY